MRYGEHGERERERERERDRESCRRDERETWIKINNMRENWEM